MGVVQPESGQDLEIGSDDQHTGDHLGGQEPPQQELLPLEREPRHPISRESTHERGKQGRACRNDHAVAEVESKRFDHPHIDVVLNRRLHG